MPATNPNAPGADQSANMPSISADTSAALDDLLKQQQEDNQPAPPAKPDPAAPARGTDGKFLKAGEPAPADGPSGPVGDKGAAGPPPGSTGNPGPTGPVDPFDAIGTPAKLSPKASEAFDNVKRLAKEKLTALQTERDELDKKFKELSEKSGRLDPKVEQELKDLREFRRKLDVEADPEFQKYDTESTTQAESIYGRLKAVGVADATIEKIKSMGGIFKVQWDPILEKIPSQARRFIEVKLTQLEDLRDKKAAAIASAKKNSEEFLTQRARATDTQREEFRSNAAKTLETMLPKLDWFAEKKITDKTVEAEKAGIAEHNKMLTDTKEAIKEAMEDDSPEMRAFLAVGLAQLMKLRVDYSAAISSHKSEVEKLQAELTAAKSLIEKVKKGSTNRLRDTTATTTPGSMPGAGTINERPADALDRLAREVEAKQ